MRLSMTIGPPVSAIVSPASSGEKVKVVPLEQLAIRSRSEPGPSSAALVTTVAAPAGGAGGVGRWFQIVFFYRGR